MSPEEEVRRTLYSFCHTFEERRFEDWANLWTEDGVFDSPHELVEGRENILARASRGRLATNPNASCQHTTVNSIIDIDGNKAKAKSHLLLLNRDGDGTGPWELKVGQYDDELEYQDGVWYFTYRKLSFPFEPPGK